MVSKKSASSNGKPLAGEWDIVVIGGALAGAATAFRILRRQPHLRVLIVEKSSVFTRRVGESTVEISSYFLGRVLGLTQYLNEHHLPKQGLRFWFHNDRTQSLPCCSETGNGYNVRLPGYQVDRSTLDEEVLTRAEAAGATVLRPARVTRFQLNPSGQQSLAVETEEGEQTFSTRWIVDASGFSAVIARKQGWIKKNDDHPIAAVWSRFKGVQDWDSLALAERYPEWAKRVFATRNTATNHFIGRGYWIWCIPLKGGDVSLGVVYDQRLVEFPKDGPLGDRLTDFIKEHPVGAELIEGATCIEGDAHARKNFAYHSRVFAGDGFVIVGDAGAFIDPFYSPGMDWVAFSTTAAVDLLDRATRGEAVAPLVDSFNERFPRSCQNWFDAIYRDKYFYMGDRELMTLAFRLDLGLYYLGIVSQPYRDGEAGLLDPPFVTPLSKPFLKLIRLYNRRFAAMGRDRMRRGVWGRQNDGHHFKFNSYTLGKWLPFRVTRALIDWALLESREGWRTWFSPPKVERSELSVESWTLSVERFSLLPILPSSFYRLHFTRNMSSKNPRLPNDCLSNPWLRLTIFGVLMGLGGSLLLWLGADWKIWVEKLSELHPALFLAAMSFLPVVGFPISAFYFYAGVVYGWAMGIPLCLGALAINMSLSYFVAQTLLREPLSQLIKRRGHELPHIRTATNQFRTTFLLRTVPGPPFSLQNYILALAGVRFLIYLPISLAAQGVIGCLVIVSTDLLTPHIEPWKLIAGALVLFAVAGLAGSFFFKRRETSAAGPADPQT